jgi:ABC-2 type transport system ATP-binding protein
MMLNVTSLNKTYSNNVVALSKVNLKIGKGMFGLLGPNGAGKSTLMRTIATLQEPDSGSIYFNNIDVIKEKTKMRSILGFLPQEFGVYKDSSAEDLLNYLCLLKGIVDKKKRKEVVGSLLEMTNLSEHRKKKLGGFSGGMKQRFGIAQALIGQPQIIIVDEPTAGLDPEERYRFQNLLNTIGDNVTVILSTHIVSDVSELCNDMAIIDKGRVLIQKSPLEALGILENKIWSKIITRNELDDYSSKYKIVSSRLNAGKVLIKVFDNNKPNGFEPIEPDLEDIYFSYINKYVG